MSFLLAGAAMALGGGTAAVVGAGVAGAGMLYKGGAAEGWWGGDPKGEIKEGKSAAYDLYQQKLGLLGEQQDISTDVANLQYDVAGQQYGIAGEQYGLAGERSDLGAKGIQSQYTSGMRDLSIQGGSAISSSRAGGSSAARKSGLVSGTAQQQAAGQERNIWAEYKSGQQKMFDTRQLGMEGIGLERKSADIGYKAAGQAYDVAGKTKAITMDEIALALERGELTEEEAYEYQKTALTEAAGPTNFFEGIFG